MRYLLIILIFLFGCSSTKKVQESTSKSEIKLETEVRKDLFEIKRTDDLAEIITRTITTRSKPEKTDSGEVILIQEQTVEEKIEKYNSKTETGNAELNSDRSTATDLEQSDLSLNKETEGQDAAKIINSASEGLTKGIFNYLFGDIAQKILIGLGIFLFLLFLFLIRKKSNS